VDLKEEAILGDQVGSHWYYRAKSAALLSNLRGQKPREILDIGAGSGFFSKVLLRATGAERAVCVDTGYPHDWDEICGGKTISFRRNISASSADLVLAMDVIEHVPHDDELLGSYRNLVASGARFIVSVPAFNFLWSAHDVFLGHYRRYTLAALRSAMRRSGLEVDWSHYYYAAVFPIAAGMRLLERANGAAADAPKSQLRRHGAVVNETFSAMLAAERVAMRANKLFGLTAFAGGHKP
jgi:hypothetical protein